MVATLFNIGTNSLIGLGKEGSVEFFRRLLWAEADRTGVSKVLISCPDCIDVSDGGIDARIEDAMPQTDGLIATGYNGFQIKSADIEPSQCKKEIHEEGKLDKPIASGIRKTLDAHGTYTVVIFKELSDTMRERRENAIKDELAHSGYLDPKVRVLIPSQLQVYVEASPSLVCWLKGGFYGCHSHQQWGDEIATPHNFEIDNNRQNAIDDIQRLITDATDSTSIIRVDGPPGVGKTRLVYEALNRHGLRERVIYVRSADSFIGSQPFHELVGRSTMSAVLVVDECDLAAHSILVRALKNAGPRIALITLSYDVGAVPENRLEIQCLHNDHMKNVIHSIAPDLPVEVMSRLAEFAGGYPRIGLLLAESYRAGSSSEDLLKINDDILFDRLIGGRDITSEHYQKTRRILRELSLFTKVGYKGELFQEAKWLAERVQVAESEFREIIRKQKERGIVQGDFYLYVTPFALRVHLISEWWQTQSFDLSTFSEFVGNIPEQFRADMLDRFSQHLSFIDAAKEGLEFVEGVLGPSGPFCSFEFLNSKIGSRMFGGLAQAAPKAALDCLKRCIGPLSPEQLLLLIDGRRELVWTLERLAMWRELFQDAARILLQLAEAENESWSNNASGIFASLFSPGPGRVAPSEASPHERLPVIREAMVSESQKRRRLAIDACKIALQTDSFTRMAGAEYQGLHKLPEQWCPKTIDELGTSYSEVWQFLRNSVETLPDSERQQAVDILLDRAYGIRRIPNMADEVIETLEDFASKAFVDNRKILERADWQLRHDSDRMGDNERSRWEKLKSGLCGSDFHSRLRRYAGMSLLDDELDEHEGKPGVKEELEQLAVEALGDTNTLIKELPWLMTPDAVNSYKFGLALASCDKEFLLLPTIIQVQKAVVEKGSAYFLGGYLHVVFEQSREQWENTLDQLAEDVSMQNLLPELTWRSGMTDRSAERILTLAHNGAIGVASFRIFTYGGVVSELVEAVIKSWVIFLLQADDITGGDIAVDLYSYYYLRARKAILPKAFTVQLLLSDKFFRRTQDKPVDTMVEYHWAELAKAYITLYPEDSFRLAEKIVQNFSNRRSVAGGFHSPVTAVLDAIAAQCPNYVWELVIRNLGGKLHWQTLQLEQWLRGEDGQGILLDLVEHEKLWAWIEKNVERRAWLTARFVPKIMSAGPTSSLARELLVKYGKRKDVRSELIASFQSGSWVGPISAHLETTKSWLLDLKSRETNLNVLLWIDEYLAHIDAEIKAARIMEEREDL